MTSKHSRTGNVLSTFFIHTQFIWLASNEPFSELRNQIVDKIPACRKSSLVLQVELICHFIFEEYSLIYLHPLTHS